MAFQELYLRNDMQQLWQGQEPFAAAFAIAGTTFRKLEQRHTLAFSVKGRCYFIKRHRGLAWKEILKNLLQLRLPVGSAHNEYEAITRMTALGLKVPVIAAYGRRGWWPSKLESFLVTEDVGEHVSLEDHCRHWAVHPPVFEHKLSLLLQIADIARTMHRSGICHRDFYICHLLLTATDEPLTVIDLHRALCKENLAQRWIIKDLAGLYFSAMDSGLTKRDVLRFIRRYTGEELGTCLKRDLRFWQAVEQRALKLYAKDKARRP